MDVHGFPASKFLLLRMRILRTKKLSGRLGMTGLTRARASMWVATQTVERSFLS